MSLLAATQIPKPADEQAFERASTVLWRDLLGDPNVQRFGRRGQKQNGVDLYGLRNGDSDHVVGIQCKLKSEGHELTEKEVRRETRVATHDATRDATIDRLHQQKLLLEQHHPGARLPEQRPHNRSKTRASCLNAF